MPCQIPPTCWMVGESRRAITMSIPGSTPSLRTPSTLPVNAVGVTPWVTVRPVTSWSTVSAEIG